MNLTTSGRVYSCRSTSNRSLSSGPVDYSATSSASTQLKARGADYSANTSADKSLNTAGKDYSLTAYFASDLTAEWIDYCLRAKSVFSADIVSTTGVLLQESDRETLQDSTDKFIELDQTYFTTTYSLHVSVADYSLRG